MLINLDKDTLLSIRYHKGNGKKVLTINISDDDSETTFLQLFKDMLPQDVIPFGIFNDWAISLSPQWDAKDKIKERKQIALDYDSIMEEQKRS